MDNEELIRDAYEKLVEALPEEMDGEHRQLIEEAFLLAKDAHSSQTRDQGLPYILHPLAVALVVVREMSQTDASLIAAALLHDVVEDTSYTIEDIRARFGADVAFLVGLSQSPTRNRWTTSSISSVLSRAISGYSYSSSATGSTI
ncbi:MAG: HD domain-containing protein [Candidatus Cryptobacteroides sp.]